MRGWFAVFSILAACDDGGATVTDGGSDAACDAEPAGNETVDKARFLAFVDDCDGSGGKFTGVVAGPSDADFWAFGGKDTVGCAVDATAAASTPDVRLCVFARCNAGTTTFKGCREGTSTTLESGDVACCGAESVSLQHACTGATAGGDDSARVFVRVDSPTAKTCLPYTVSYHF